MKVALDTNLLVRLLTNDDTAQAARVEAWLLAHATPQLPAYVDHVVLCELGRVLQHSHAHSRSHVHDAIAALLEYTALGVENWHCHRPHPGKEAKPYQVEEARELLERAGVKP